MSVFIYSILPMICSRKRSASRSHSQDEWRRAHSLKKWQANGTASSATRFAVTRVLLPTWSANFKVGFKHRFENVVKESTRIIYLTDGMLLKEYTHDKELKRYACIVLDEVHGEWSSRFLFNSSSSRFSMSGSHVLTARSKQQIFTLML